MIIIKIHILKGFWPFRQPDLLFHTDTLPNRGIKELQPSVYSSWFWCQWNIPDPRGARSPVHAGFTRSCKTSLTVKTHSWTFL